MGAEGDGMSRLFVWVLAGGCLCGCSDGAPAESRSSSLNAFEFSEYCAETGTESCDRCRDRIDEERDECLRVCAALAERTGSSECFASCRVERAVCEPECRLEPSSCAAPGFRFEPSLSRDPALESACASANARNLRCRQAPARMDCAAKSRLERSEAAQVYACLAELECGADTDPCLETLGESELGASLAAACPADPLDEGLISALNRAAVWARPEVLADAAVCAERACFERGFSACVQAWMSAM